MRRRNWKKVRPNSLRHAMELCLEYAREKKRRSVDHVADLMGIASKWTLYKWLENGRIPAILIRPFEHACGIDFVTQYIAYSDHKLLIDIPTVKSTTEMEINELQGAFSEAMTHLIRFSQGSAEADETLAALTDVMAGLAYHRENVSKAVTPELGLFEEDDTNE